MIISLDVKDYKYYTLQQKICDCSIKSIKKFLKNCPDKFKSFIPEIESSTYTISINKKFIDIYGMAYRAKKYEIKKIEYSKELKNLSKKQIYLIVAHEMAHIIDDIIRGCDCPAHDKHWKYIVSLMDGQPHSTIDISLK